MTRWVKISLNFELLVQNSSEQYLNKKKLIIDYYSKKQIDTFDIRIYNASDVNQAFIIKISTMIGNANWIQQSRFTWFRRYNLEEVLRGSNSIYNIEFYKLCWFDTIFQYIPYGLLGKIGTIIWLASFSISFEFPTEQPCFFK